MLTFGSSMQSSPVLSLQNGQRVATTTNPLIDPRNLTIVAYWCDGVFRRNRPTLLLIKDVREFSRVGFIIDSEDELVDKEDMLSLKKLFDINFKLINIDVYDEDGKKIGKVEDYSIEPKSFVIEQLRIKRPIMKSFNSTSFLVNRSQVVEITNRRIIIKSSKVDGDVKSEVEQQGFVNPFATANPQAEVSDSPS